MGKRTRSYPYIGREGFGGGLTTESPISVLTEGFNKMVVANNVLIGTTVSRKKRGGKEKYNTGGQEGGVNYPDLVTPIRGITEFWRTATFTTPVSDLFLHQGTKVWSIDDRNTVGVDRTGALTLDANGIPSYQVFFSVIYFCSSVTADGYNKWDGIAASAVAATAPPDGPGKYLTIHYGRMVMAGNEDFPYRVYFSAPLDPEDWTGVDATSLDLPDDGDPNAITGISSFYGRLYVFTRRSIYEITGTTPSDFVVNKISNGIGTISHQSIVQTPNDIFFASDRGVHSLKQLSSGRQSESMFLSREIQKFWVESINSALYSRAYAYFDETTNNYIISMPSSGQLKNDLLLCYNTEFGTWTLWPEINARCISGVLVNNKKTILIGEELGRIGLLNTNATTDYDAGFTYRWNTNVLYPGGLANEKTFKSVTVFLSSKNVSTVTIGWNVDGKRSGSRAIQLQQGVDVLTSSFVLGVSELGTTSFLPYTIPIDQVGYGLQLEAICGGDNDVEIFGFILDTEDVNENYGTYS